MLPWLRPGNGWRARVAAWLTVGLAGCADLVDLPEGLPPLLVVESLLVAGSASAELRVTMVPALGSEPWEAPAPSPVSLRLVSARGARVDFNLVPDSAGLYRAVVSIVGGARYRLEGTVGGRTIAAETTVPAALEIVRPADDTIPLPLGSVARVPLRWRSRGATLLVSAEGQFPFGRPGTGVARVTRDSVAELLLGPPDEAADRSIDFRALNRDAERYYFDPISPRTNVVGAFGVLSGAAPARRVVRWR
jgi:hypothetical protein